MDVRWKHVKAFLHGKYMLSHSTLLACGQKSRDFVSLPSIFYPCTAVRIFNVWMGLAFSRGGWRDRILRLIASGQASWDNSRSPSTRGKVAPVATVLK